MFKQINIILCFLLLFAFNWISAQNNFKIYTPEFIPSNDSFEISMVTSNKLKNADHLDLFLSPDISLIVNNVRLISRDQNINLPVSNEYRRDLNENFQRFRIDLTDSTNFSNTEFFQLIVGLKSSQASSNSLKFFGEFRRDKKVIGYLVNSDLKETEGEEHHYELTFNYYQKYPIAGKSLSLLHSAYLNVPLNFQIDEMLSVEFWMKIKNTVSTFLEIINSETNKIEYNLSINENQLLIINSFNNELLPVRSFFFSKDIWYHFNICFDKQNSELTFLCSGQEIARFKIINGTNFEDFVLHFQNEKMNSEFFLEQMRIVNCINGSRTNGKNKNFIDYSDENSRVIVQINFTDSGLNKLLNKRTIFYDNLRLVKSDAPIFPRSPEINVNLSDTYYEIEWQGGNYKYASQYILERAIGSEEFTKIESVDADNNIKKEYSLITERIQQPEIIFFRIKQINKDGSVVYSDVAKVGQGIIDDVIIGQNFPNPFNPTTLIEFELLQDSDVEVKVYNLAGREIAVLNEGFLNRGIHQFKFNAEGFPSGVYIYQITTPLSTQTRKMILAK